LSKRILLVDDEDDVREVAQLSLEMDGPTTFRSLQANPATRDIPVVLLTARLHSADGGRMEGLGVAGNPREALRPAHPRAGRLAGAGAAWLNGSRSHPALVPPSLSNPCLTS
jgi:CheY-like chemotaxis protein